LNRRIKSVTAAFVALFAFSLGSPAPAPGQGIGVYRVGQGRRVGRVTLPTPPFNPDAGILDSGKGRGRKAPKTVPYRSLGRGKHAVNRNPLPGTSRGRRVRRGR
jgi:hypothetical protein